MFILGIKQFRKLTLKQKQVLPSDPKLKRKAQNRAAQRAFRERKEQFVNELQDQMRELRAEKEKREKELARENARLKKENERLKEENYILKDAKFTFEFPRSSKTGITAAAKASKDKGTTKASALISPPITDDQLVSVLDSPLSDIIGDDDDELSDYQPITGESTPFDSGNQQEPELVQSHDDDNSDLFHNTNTTNNTTKENLFLTPTNYNNNNNEEPSDFINNTATVVEPLPQLFGNEMDIFDIENPAPFQMDPLFSEQMQQMVQQEQQDAASLLKCAPENAKPCKSKILAVLGKAKGANRSIYQVNQDVKSYCPDFNLDQLCEDLNRKINFDQNHILTDEDVDLYIECIKRNT